MDIDDDEPPLLVSGNGQDKDAGAVTADIESLQLSRVPITIVTGRIDIFHSNILSHQEK